MKREFGLEQIVRDAASVVTVGTFDGVHVGHRAILRYLIARAREQSGISVVVTFSPHPREVVHGEAVPLLTTIDERADVMEQLGIERFIVLPFTKEFSKLQAEAFVEEILVGRIGLREIVIGYDHAFGKDRRGDADLLAEQGRRHAFTVDVIPPQVVEQHVVSSSEIRELLVSNGKVALAGEMLGRPYGLSGTVARGQGRGRTLGFPTANLSPDHDRKVIPRAGVYAVRVYLDLPVDGKPRYDGMMNIGRRPTFSEETLVLEVHVLDFEGDLYDRKLRVEFVERMRDEEKFDSATALREQLYRDRERCRQLLAAAG